MFHMLYNGIIQRILQQFNTLNIRYNDKLYLVKYILQYVLYSTIE